MARSEIDYFKIGNSYGGNQEWFSNFMMRLGGCGAETACDCSILFSRNFGKKSLYPFNDETVSKEEYVKFSKIMEPYLKPRRTGINTLKIYIDGYGKYIEDTETAGVTMRGLPGEESYETARDAVITQIDKGLPVSALTLYHSNRRFRDYQWHWYIINAYDKDEEDLKARTVTYSEYEWVDFRELWNTGRTEKGGLILFDIEK